MMEEILKVIEDYKRENFTAKEWVVYGIIAPILLIIICGLAGV